MFQESRFYEMGEWQGIPRLMSSGVTEEWKAPKNMVGWCRMDSRGSVVTACETVGSIKPCEVLDQLFDHQTVMEDWHHAALSVTSER